MRARQQVVAVEIPVRRSPTQAAPPASSSSSPLSSDHGLLSGTPEPQVESLFPSGTTTPLTISLQEAHERAQPRWITYDQWLSVLNTAERSLPEESEIDAEAVLPWLVASLRYEQPTDATDSRYRALEFLSPANLAFLQQIDELLLVYRWTWAAAAPTPSDDELASTIGLPTRPRTDPTPVATTPRTQAGPTLRPRRATSTRPGQG